MLSILFGAGVNYTLFFDEKATGPLEGADLDLDASIDGTALETVEIDPLVDASR